MLEGLERWARSLFIKVAYTKQIETLQDVPLPKEEERRLAALKGLNILDTPPEERFDRITRTAAHIFDTPISFVTLIDANRQWFKSCYGPKIEDSDKRVSFCAYAILKQEVFVVEDMKKDDRFKYNPLVTGVAQIRFYAGAPIATPEGLQVGTLCILDHHPRSFSDADKKLLADLSAWAELEINNTQTSRALVERKKAQKALEKMKADLEVLVAERTRDLANAVADLKQNKALSDRLIRIMSHQIRTPLNASRWELEEVIAGSFGKLSAEQKSFLQMIYNRNVTVIVRLHDVLETIDIENKLITCKKESVEIQDLIKSIVPFWDKRFTAKSMTLKVPAKQKNLPIIECDPQKVRAIIERLLQNALDYSEPNGVTQMTVKASAEELEISIKDDGIGIPAFEQNNIFNRFFRCAEAVSKNPDGSGLGLYIASQYAGIMNGKITFSSKEGKGSVFTLHLPLVNAKSVNETKA